MYVTISRNARDAKKKLKYVLESVKTRQSNIQERSFLLRRILKRDVLLRYLQLI